LPPGQTTYSLISFLERYGFVLLIIFIFFGFQYILPIITYIYRLISGAPLAL